MNHGISPQFILLAQLNSLKEALVLSQDGGSNTTELKAFVVLKLLSKGCLVEGLTELNATTELNIIILFNEQFVKGLINLTDISILLDNDKVRLDERKEEATTSMINNNSMVKAGDEGLKELIDKVRLLKQVEVDTAVEELSLENLRESITKFDVIPSISAVINHDLRSMIIILTAHVQESKSLPLLIVTSATDDLSGLHLGIVGTKEVHELLLSVLGVEDSKLSEHARMSLLKSDTSLK